MLKKVPTPSLPIGPKAVAEPEKELRFTRARQGYVLLSLSAVLLSTGLTLFATSTAPASPEGLWIPALPCTLLGLGLIFPALRCIRHAYLILSPLGIEIFPFFRPEKNLQIIYWSEISHAEINAQLTRLIIHTNAERTAGVIASLSPIRKNRRTLLERAISGTMAKRETEDKING